MNVDDYFLSTHTPSLQEITGCSSWESTECSIWEFPNVPIDHSQSIAIVHDPSTSFDVQHMICSLFHISPSDVF